MTTSEEVLNATVHDGDIGTCTVRQYLFSLLEAVWAEKDGFNGKRPFGNSGWEFDLYTALVRYGLVYGVVDDDGYLEIISDEDRNTADALIAEAIRSME